MRRLKLPVTVVCPVVVLGNTADDTAQLVPVAKDLFGATAASTFTYASSVPAKMTVSNTGLLTRVAAGASNITVTSAEGWSVVVPIA
jgi:uncharacterized protein YjdB